ncbi:39S ribosomal protein L37, mitochondrial-like [Mizuhopecten yessoensis]|uniref:39S ribosomal protein L37, mitochondrial n=1 Tax=Mizuhopecten yessoensis TaxID=6573 RepID=A0A210QLZ9_MIZYE|nr:39S ribosomal protein L37, mitochondrial-like [Mizuhopecten yessoensis]XP_021354886.1 39S ribosomal protein L37, mitochondrial-like [Mizuhopecten yessoensis]OWF49757.1 39S ribosomal protein L37, mitochondrial [Mizuhopecten yessoensis]
MRLTPPLLKHQIVRPFKRAWAAKYPYKVADNKGLPKALVLKGIEIKDPYNNERTSEKLEPVAVPATVVPTKGPEEDLPGYNTKPVMEFTDTTRFIEGIRQAQHLTKSIVYNGMPEGVSSLMDRVEHSNQNKLLKRIILQSQKWDPAKDKLPRRIDKSCIKWNFQREYGIPRSRSIHILNTNLVRLANIIVNGHCPAAITDRQLHVKPAFDSHYTFMGEEIVLKGTPNFLLTGSYPLPPFSDESTVSSTTEEILPNMFPILPTIDFKSTHFYNLTNSVGFLSNTDRHPHTFVTSSCDFWKDDFRQARSVMFCLAYTIAEARLRFGEDVQTLPEPICIQSVSVGETGINFVFFQLNTLDFSSESGVKNQAWLDTGNNLYTKIMSQPWNGSDFTKHRYTDFIETPFSKLLAAMQYGLPPS